MHYKYYRLENINELEYSDVTLAFNLTIDHELPERETVANFLTILHNFNNTHGCFAIGRDKNEVCTIAYIKDAAKDKNGVARIEHLYVDPKFRNQNIGATFLKKIVKDYDKSSGLTVACEKKLVPFCLKCGFKNAQLAKDGSQYYVLHTQSVPCKPEDSLYHTSRFNFNDHSFSEHIKNYRLIKAKYLEQSVS